MLECNQCSQNDLLELTITSEFAPLNNFESVSEQVKTNLKEYQRKEKKNRA